MQRMSRIKRLLTAAVCTIAGLAWYGPQTAKADDIVPGHILVRVKPGVDARVLAANYGARLEDQVAGTDLYSFVIPRIGDEQKTALRLSADGRVLYAEPNRFIISPEVDGQPFHFAFDLSPKPTTYANSVTYTQINLGQTDALQQVNGKQPLATGKGVVIAVLDTGATFTHPDLQGHYVIGYNALNPALAPNDVADGVTNGEYGHGTMVAGLIARVAPQASIMPVRILNGDGNGTLLTLIQGLHYATTHGAQIINMSFGCSVKSGALNDTLDEAELAGVVLVAAAGNNNLSQALPPTVGRGTIAVAAVEGDNTKSPYSNYGSYVRVVAPGSGLRSTYADGGYATWSGTSFSTPLVAAEAALILSAKPGMVGDDVKKFIRNTAHSVDKTNPAYKGQLGNGVIDIEAAVKSALKH